MSDEIRRIQSQDPEVQEVFVCVLEFVRPDPLESEFRQRIVAALRGVAGVTSADEHDREMWFVTGAPSGKSLIEAVALVVDDLAERAHAEVLRW